MKINIQKVKASLEKLKHPGLDEVENRDCFDDVFFIHLKSDWEFSKNKYGYIGSWDCGSIKEAKEALKLARKI